LLLCVQAVFSAGIARVDEGDHCDECTKYFDDTLESSLRQKLLSMEPLTVKGLGPHCKTCTLTGLHDIKRIEDKPICVTKKEDGSVVRHMAVEFRNFSAQCDCVKNHDPTQMIKDFTEVITNPVITKCIPKRFMESKAELPAQIDSQDAEDLQTCIPHFFNSLRSKEIYNIKQFKIGSSAQNGRFSFDLVTKPGRKEATIENMQILNEEPPQVQHRCEGPDFLIESCRCLMETKYLHHLQFEVMKVVAPCHIEYHAKEFFPEVLNEMACPV